MAKQLSHDEFLKLGNDWIKKGHPLNKIEAEFRRQGADEKEAIRALKELEPEAKKIEAAKLEEQRAKQTAQQQTQPKKKSSSWLWLILLTLIVIGLLYLFFWQDKAQYFIINFK